MVASSSSMKLKLPLSPLSGFCLFLFYMMVVDLFLFFIMIIEQKHTNKRALARNTAHTQNMQAKLIKSKNERVRSRWNKAYAHHTLCLKQFNFGVLTFDHFEQTKANETTYNSKVVWSTLVCFVWVWLAFGWVVMFVCTIVPKHLPCLWANLLILSCLFLIVFPITAAYDFNSYNVANCFSKSLRTAHSAHWWSVVVKGGQTVCEAKCVKTLLVCC